MSTSPEQPKSDSIELQSETPATPAPPAQPTALELQRTPNRDALAALTPLMRQAFVLMTQGLPPKEIIAEVGVPRSTWQRWKKYNPKFRAALNAWHQDQVQSTQLSMVATLPDAVQTIREKIKSDANLALKVVGKCGGFAPPPTGCVSPKQVRQEIKLELRREKLRARKRREKLHLQELEQRAKELEDKLEAARIEKMRKMDPAELLRIRERTAAIEQLAEKLHEARKHDPDYKLDENYVRAVLNPEAFRDKATPERDAQERSESEVDPDEHS